MHELQGEGRVEGREEVAERPVGLVALGVDDELGEEGLDGVGGGRHCGKMDGHWEKWGVDLG